MRTVMLLIVAAGMFSTLAIVYAPILREPVESMSSPLPEQRVSPLPQQERPARPAAVRAPDMTDPSDGMAYVEASLALAKAGDHRVQYYIAKVAMRCAPLYHNYLAGEVQPEADEWRYCGSFEQPIPDGQYWLDQAIAGKDALAMLHVARDEFYAFSGERGTRERLDEAIERAHASGDPEVQAMLASATIAANLPEVP